MKLLRLLTFTAGAAVGYVVGAKQGQQGLDRIKSTARDTWNDPKVQDAVHKVGDQANRVAHDVADQAKGAVSSAAESAGEKVSEAADDAKGKIAEKVGRGDSDDAGPSGGSRAAVGGAEKGDPGERLAPAVKADSVSDPGLGDADSTSGSDSGGDWADEGGRPATSG